MKIKKKQRFYMVIAMFGLVAVGVALVLYNFNDNIIFFYTPSEMHSKKIRKTVRIGGLVKKGSIIKQKDHTKFVVTDLKKEIMVKYQGALPTLFRDEQGVVIKGKFIENYFQANEILAKHDEKYMPQEVIDVLKDSSQWKP